MEKFGTGKDGGFVVLFEFDPFAHNIDRVASHIRMNVTAPANKQMVDTLVEGNYYIIKGNFRKFVDDIFEISTPIIKQDVKGLPEAFKIDNIILPSTSIDIVSLSNASKPVKE